MVLTINAADRAPVRTLMKDFAKTVHQNRLVVCASHCGGMAERASYLLFIVCRGAIRVAICRQPDSLLVHHGVFVRGTAVCDFLVWYSGPTRII